jgi:hypothetical protein
MVDSFESEVVKIVNGYSYLAFPNGEYEDAIEFSPWDGSELPNAFMWEFQHQLYDLLQKNENGEFPKHSEFFCELSDIKKVKGLLTSEFDPDSIPAKLGFLLAKRDWFDQRITDARKQHTPGQQEYCGGFSAFLDSCYGMKELPIVTKVAISFCPYCGIRLPPEFNTDEWWEKRES